MVILQLISIAKGKNCELIFCHLYKRVGFGKKVSKAFKHIKPNYKFKNRVFRATDKALEYAENILLTSVGSREWLTIDLFVYCPGSYAELIFGRWVNIRLGETFRITLIIKWGFLGTTLTKEGIRPFLTEGEKFWGEFLIIFLGVWGRGRW